MDFVESCRKFISLDSSPTRGTKDIAKWAAEYCRSRGLFVEVQEEVLGDQEQANILVRPVPERPQLEFLFQTHLDTSDPGPFGYWSETGHNPFDAHIIDNKIYGLGAADTKLDFLCKLEAIASFGPDAKWKLPPVLVGTYGEELGMVGALKLIRKNKISTRMAVIGEPSDLRLITAGKGMAHVEIRIPYGSEERNYRFEHNLRESTSTQSRIFHGKAAHSSTPHLGDSAIRKMMDYLAQLPEGIVVMEMDGGINFNTVPANAFLEIDPVSGIKDPMSLKVNTIYKAINRLEADFQRYTDPEFTPANPTLNIGLVRTEEDHVLISGSCRLPPVVTNEVYERWMRDLDEVCKSVGAQFRVADYKRPYKTEHDSMLVRGCIDEIRKLGLDPATMTQSSTNEASLWSRVGIECVSFGPGKRDGNIHTPKEHVDIADLKKAIEFYKSVIERFCI